MKNNSNLKSSLFIAIISGLFVAPQLSAQQSDFAAIANSNQQLYIAQNSQDSIVQTEGTPSNSSNYLLKEEFDERINTLEKKLLESESNSLNTILIVISVNLLFVILILISIEVLNRKFRKFEDKQSQKETENHQNNLKEQVQNREKTTQSKHIYHVDSSLTVEEMSRNYGKYCDDRDDDNEEEYSRHTHQKKRHKNSSNPSPENRTNTAVHNQPDTKLVKDFDSKLRSLAKQGFRVSVPEDSLEKRRQGSNQAIILQNDPQGEYFVLQDNNYYYLFPDKSLKVNQFSYKIVEKLFRCYGYESSSSGEFRLIKAAKVISRSQNTEWVLREPGELNFI